MRESNKRKQRIIDAAIEVLKENSIEETTVRKIAARAGLTTGALYHHYKNKDDLVFDVITQSLQFTHRLSGAVKNESSDKKGNELLSEIVSEVAKRLSKADEQKLHLRLLNDVIAKNSPIKRKYQKNYGEIINNTANLFDKAFDIQNDEYKRSVAAILVAAIDGIAIQQALDVLPEDQDKMIENFILFFAESIPIFLKNHQSE